MDYFTISGVPVVVVYEIFLKICAGYLIYPKSRF